MWWAHNVWETGAVYVERQINIQLTTSIKRKTDINNVINKVSGWHVHAIKQ